MSPPILYTLDASPPCRATYMTAKAIGVDLEHKIVNVVKHEQLEPWFIKMNPRHTVPTLVDGDLILCDSHAITAYLVGKYAKNDDLYPTDVAKRALVDQMMHFDSNVSFPALLSIALPLRLKLTKEISEDKKLKVQEGYSFLEKYLAGNEWVSLDHPTLADIHLISTITSGSLFMPYDDYPNINAWVKRFKKLDYYEENVKGLDEFNTLFSSLLGNA